MLSNALGTISDILLRQKPCKSEAAMKTLLVLVTILIISINSALAADGPVENLPGLISGALANNPELKSSQARWQMFANKARQASSLDDPMFMFKLQNMLARE